MSSMSLTPVSVYEGAARILETAYIRIYKGQRKVTKVKRGTSPGRGKIKTKKYKITGQIPYKYLQGGITIKDSATEKDEVNISFSGLPYDHAEELLEIMKEGKTFIVVWGVKGRWHNNRLLCITSVEGKYGPVIEVNVVLHGSSAFLMDKDETTTFNNVPVSQIVSDLAKTGSLEPVIRIKEDPVIPHLTTGRRSALEVLTDLSKQYGYVLRFANGKVILEDHNLKQNPVRVFNYGGRNASIVSFTSKTQMAGQAGSSTIVKRREGNNKKNKKTSKNQTKALAIQYKAGGKYTTRTFTRSTATVAAGQAPPSDKKSRTHHTLKQGKAAQKKANALNRQRGLGGATASFEILNDTVPTNSIVHVQGTNTRWIGRYWTHDVEYSFDRGLITTTVNVARTIAKRKSMSSKGKSKSKKASKKKGTIKTKTALAIQYKKGGKYSTSKFTQKVK